MGFWQTFIIVVIGLLMVCDIVSGFEKKMTRLKESELQTIICDRLSERLGIVVYKQELYDGNGSKMEYADGYDREKYWYTFNYAGYQYKVKADSIDDYVKEIIWDELHIKIEDRD